MKFLRLLALVALLVAAPLSARAQTADASGDWRGTLNVGSTELRVAMHLGATSTLDSPDQSSFGVPAQMTTTVRRVMVAVPSINAVFEGELSEDGARLAGEWRQAGQSWPLSFERGAFAAANRPQTPAAPFPYRAEEVAYDNAQRPGVHLAGTLTLPEGRGRFPAVLLITGSGAQDRNEALMGHQPFLVLADYLSRRGFAVLRVDDRGVGGSRGATPNDTMHDYATDVEAGIAFLRSRLNIDHRRIALIGHSEGGLIAPIVASRDPSIAAIVLWAGPGVRGGDLLVEQLRAVLTSMGVPAEQVEAQARTQRQVMDALISAPDAEAARAAVGAVLSSAPGATHPEAQAQVNLISRPWFRAFAAYDPQPTLSALRMPVLALLGGKDVQVVATQNEPALRAALAGNRRARVETLPGLNHLFQSAMTGGVAEYARIEQTIAPEALAAMGDWLTQTLRVRPRR